MKRISILGSGWLGFPLALAFHKQGFQVKASSRTDKRLSPVKKAGIETHLLDIEESQISTDFFQADILIVNITSKNVEAFQRLIAVIEQSTIQHVVFISSTSVYANSKNLHSASVTEEDHQQLINCPLLKIERLFQASSQFTTTIIRFAGLIGYQRHPGRFFLATTEHDEVYCKTIKNPDACVNMIHRDDCLGLIEAVIKNNVWGEVFNACATSHPARRDFYQAAMKHLSDFDPIFSGQTDSVGKVISNEKIKEQLNYSFIYDDLLNFKSMPFN